MYALGTILVRRLELKKKKKHLKFQKKKTFKIFESYIAIWWWYTFITAPSDGYIIKLSLQLSLKVSHKVYMLLWYGLCFINFYRSAGTAAGTAVAIYIALLLHSPLPLALQRQRQQHSNTDTGPGTSRRGHEMWKVEHLPGHPPGTLLVILSYPPHLLTIAAGVGMSSVSLIIVGRSQYPVSSIEQSYPISK